MGATGSDTDERSMSHSEDGGYMGAACLPPSFYSNYERTFLAKRIISNWGSVFASNSFRLTNSVLDSST